MSAEGIGVATVGLDLGQHPGASESFAKFADIIGTTQSAHDQRIEQAMQGIYGLALGFAGAMIKASMPVDYAIKTTYEAEPSSANQWDPDVTSRQKLPIWLVVHKTDLAGRELRRAQLQKEIDHHSLLSHSYSGSHMEYKDVDPDKIDSLPKLGYQEELDYYERAIAITAAGKLLYVHRHFRGDERWLFPRGTEGFSVSSNKTEVQPSDLFDTEAKIEPKRLISAMEDRLKDRLEQYRIALNEEREKGPVFRDQSYYAIADLPIPKPKRSVEEPSRGWFRRRRR